jgi:hypothetical protein
MEYKVKSANLQDIQTKTIEIFATAQELGSLSSGNLLIPAADIASGLSAGQVFKATNLTLSEELSPSIVSTDLSLDGSSAISASNKIHLIIKL